MAGYVALPNELKDLINLSRRDISRLSRTSKSMRNALLPSLYRRISLSWEASKPPPRISRLLQVILRSPYLAAIVEELSFHGKGYRERISNPVWKTSRARKNVPKYFLEAKPKADKAITGCKPLLEKEMLSLELPKEEWKQVLGGEHELDFVIAVIAIHCPSLRVLRLDTAFLHQNAYLSKILHHYLIGTGSSISSLTKLESVYLAQDIPPWTNTREKPLIFPLSSCLPFFYLPSLEQFEVALPDRIGFTKPRPLPTEWPTTTPPICNIRTLNLYKTRATPATLNFILKQTPHLESLTYDHWCRSGEKLNCVELHSALDLVCRTLKELTISFEPFTVEAEEIDDMGPWITDSRGLGSLVSLAHLTKLEIALPILLGWDGDDDLKIENVLPSTLEEICLRDDCSHYSGMIWDEERSIEEVRRWLENKAWKKSTPNLRRFGLRLDQSQIEEWSFDVRKCFMSICKRERVAFWFEKCHYDYEWNDDKGIYEQMGTPLRYPI